MPEHDEDARRLGRRNGRHPTQPPEQRDLAEEVAGTEANGLQIMKRDGDFPLADDKKGVSGRAFAHELSTCANFFHLEPPRHLGEF